MGGAAGVGRALALGMAEAGADVVACGRTRAAVDKTVRAIEALRALTPHARAGSRPWVP
jgi:short-subunit dehydrogenase involved in D-alanine esterification of teichoic acids